MSKQNVTLKDFMEIANYDIDEAWKYQWSCYGSTAFGLDAGNVDGSEGHEYAISIVFDIVTQTVYEMSAFDYDNDRAYRYINPDYVEAHNAESSQRGLDSKRAWEGTDYIELEVPEDIIEKARAISLGEDYDTRISIGLDLEESEIFFLMKLAHENDMTLNDYVEKLVLDSVVK